MPAGPNSGDNLQPQEFDVRFNQPTPTARQNWKTPK